MSDPRPQAILCLDIDGTLLDSDKKIHPNDVRLLQDFPPEIQLILATGRPLHSAKPALQANGVFTQPRLPIPGVFMNGGAAYFPNEELCITRPLSQETVEEIYLLSKDFPDSEFVFFSVSKAYLANRTPYGDMLVKDHFINVVGEISGEPPENIIKILTLSDDPDTLALIRQATRHLDAEMVYSLPTIFEFNPPGVTKGATLKQLLLALAMDTLPIFAAGDGENDLALLSIAKRAFAPANAHPAVLEQANVIIPRNKNGLLEPILENINLSK
ncbi:MAG: HAD family phosphatase [Anaerolineaceae bacterium]|nr:HAD family phosphatase [Anaerolineaceae bacterium]